MSLIDTNGVLAAARAGQRLGEAIQQENAISAWENYASNLKNQLENAQRVIDEQNVDIGVLKKQLGVYKERNGDLADIARNAADLVGEKNEKIAAMMEAEIKHKKFVESKIKGIERACQSQSAKSAAFEEIYKLLVTELQKTHDPSTIESLDFAKRTAVIKEVMENFMKTGNTFYHPDLDFTYQKNQPAISGQ